MLIELTEGLIDKAVSLHKLTIDSPAGRTSTRDGSTLKCNIYSVKPLEDVAKITKAHKATCSDALDASKLKNVEVAPAPVVLDYLGERLYWNVTLTKDERRLINSIKGEAHVRGHFSNKQGTILKAIKSLSGVNVNALPYKMRKALYDKVMALVVAWGDNLLNRSSDDEAIDPFAV